MNHPTWRLSPANRPPTAAFFAASRLGRLGVLVVWLTIAACVAQPTDRGTDTGIANSSSTTNGAGAGANGALVAAQQPGEFGVEASGWIGADEAEREAQAAREAEREAAERRSGRVRTYDLQHIRARLEFDLSAGRIWGHVEYTLAPIVRGFRYVEFDQIGMEFSDVTANGQPVEFELKERAIRIVLPEPIPLGQRISVALRYSAAPRAGMYFWMADGVDPEAKHSQIYTQGEPELTRHWLPCYDYPNDKTTSEMIVVAPAGLTALSNGQLIGVTDLDDGRREFHWRQDQPHVTYLISVVVGHYEPIRERWQEIPVTYWVPPQVRETAPLSFAATPRMMTFLGDFFGVPYPWDKYDQAVIYRFRYAGMENITLSNIHYETLHDARAQNDGESSEWLVMHELAHQWFGNLVTMRSWPHLWLNEGFASYTESLWVEHTQSVEAMRWKLENSRGAFTWADNRRPAPIVRPNASPEQMLDGRTYQKGAWVLHMLREQLGTPTFQRSVKHYLEKFRGADSHPVTHDLRIAFEETSGENLRAFFTQWVYRAGWPKLEIAWRHTGGDDGMLHVTIVQTQQVSEVWPIFDITLPLIAVGDDGTEAAFVARINRQSQTFSWPCSVEPLWLRIDPNRTVLRETRMIQPPWSWRAQLTRDADPVARLEALRHVFTVAKESTDDDEKRAMGRTLALALTDDFREMRRETVRHILTLIAEKQWRDDPHEPIVPKLRAISRDEAEMPATRGHALEALAHLRDPDSLDYVQRIVLNGHDSYRLHAMAIPALGIYRGAEAVPAFETALAFHSHREQIRGAAIWMLVAHAPETGIPLALEAIKYGNPPPLREHALNVLNDQIGRREAVYRAVVALLGDPDWRIRRRVPGMLADKAPTTATRDALAERLPLERDLSVASSVRRAVDSVRRKLGQAVPEGTTEE